jgi:hypothetical protein
VTGRGLSWRYSVAETARSGRCPRGVGFSIRCRGAALQRLSARPAHVVQQEVGVRPDQLEALLGPVFQAVVTCFGVWQDCSQVEQLFAAGPTSMLAPFGDAEVAGVEGDEVEGGAVDLQPVADARFLAVGASTQVGWLVVQSPQGSGWRRVDRPMSPAKAPADCSRTGRRP